MKFPLPLTVGAITFAIMPPNLLGGDPAKLLMPFLGLFMAGIFPAISLTINSLKSGGFSVKRVTNLADELDKLLNYLQMLFMVALTASLTIVSAETLDWGRNFYFDFYTSRIFNIIIGSCFGILIFGLPNIRRTFKSLLKISREIAVDEASTKIKDRMSNMPSIIDRFPTKEKFGELFTAERMDE